MLVSHNSRCQTGGVLASGVVGIALLVCAACGQTPTQLVVVVDSDLQVPRQLDEVTIDLIGPNGELRGSVAAVDDRGALPAVVTVVHRGDGPLAPVSVTATGTVGGREVVQQRAVTAFVEGEIRVLSLFLGQGCVDISCAPEQTCRDGECVASEVRVDQLAPWSGSFPRATQADAGVDGGGPCGPGCPSAPPNASSECVDGSCTLACDPLWADCNNDIADGCEVLLGTATTCGGCDVACALPRPLCAEVDDAFQCVDDCGDGLTLCALSCVDRQTSASHCGACDRECPAPPNASAVCNAGSCGFACDEGFGDCDGEPSNGCESALRDEVDCGACESACALPGATEACADQTCTLLSCEQGRGDCDLSPANGCEIDLDTTLSHCGACNNACPPDPEGGSYRCNAGRCALVCDLGLADCDSNPGTGCEANLGDATSCGACTVQCAAPTGRCTGDPTAGYACAAVCTAPAVACGLACVGLTTDPAHCGACGTKCPDPPRSMPTCVGGTCGYACDPGWGDCDAQAMNGCETSLTTATDCGACGVLCGPVQATGVCPAGACQVQACDPGFGDCDGSAANGCETALTSLSNCGACGLACILNVPGATGVRCAARRCVPTCEAGRGDCDRMLSNGCETDLATVTDCGSCDATCTLAGAQETCDTGACRIQTCDPGHANCDGSQGNGCETDLTSDNSHCGGCRLACASGASCCGGVCEMGPCP